MPPSPEGAITNGSTCPSRLVVIAVFLGVGPQFISKVVAFGENIIDTALTLGDVFANLKLAIHPHIVDRVQLHAVRV